MKQNPATSVPAAFELGLEDAAGIATGATGRQV